MDGFGFLTSFSNDKESTYLPRAEMNKLIMEYLVTEGYKDAAEKFRIESGVQPTLNLDSLDNRILITTAILEGRIEDSVRLIDSLFPEVLEKNQLLYFRLQQQHLIELIREKQVEKALDFAQTNLASQGASNPDILNELEKTMALLAFDDPERSTFGDLLHSSQRQKVASDMNEAILDMDSKPKLQTLIKLLHWCQSALDEKKVVYSKMTDISRGTNS